MSEKKTKLYILILEIDPMIVGHHYDGGLHTTIIYWFFTNEDYREIAGKISEVAKNHRPFQIEAFGEEDFGDEEELQVFLVEKSKDIVSLHNSLLSGLGSVEYESLQYQRSGWRPHVTTQGEKSFPTGSRHTVENMYLIEALNCEKDGEKLIRAKVELGSGEITT